MDKCKLRFHLFVNGGGISIVSVRLPQSLLALYGCTPLQVQVRYCAFQSLALPWVSNISPRLDALSS